MDQSIITRYGTVVTRLTMFKFQHSELVFESEKSKHNLFHGVIEKKLSSSMPYPENLIPKNNIYYEDSYEEAPSLFPYDEEQ